MATLAGLALVHFRAIWEVARDKKSPFIRTPKQGKRMGLRPQTTYRLPVDSFVVGELVMGCYLLIVVIYAVFNDFFQTAPFLALMAFGFLYVGVQSLGLRGIIGSKRRSSKQLVATN